MGPSGTSRGLRSSTPCEGSARSEPPATTFIGIGPLEIPADHFLPKTVQFVVRHGWCSVQVFWVIAGFVVAYSLRKTAVRPVSFGNFTLRHILRLGMPYWTAILAGRGHLTFSQSPGCRRPASADRRCRSAWSRLAANLGFLQDILHLGNISAGTWSVCVDLQFGLLFMIMLGIAQAFSWPLSGNASSPNLSGLVLTLVFVPLGLASLFWFNLDPDDYSAWVIYYFHLPLFGAMAWWALERRIPRVVFWAFAAVLVGGIVYRWNLGLDYKQSLEIVVALIAGVRIYVAGRRGHLGDWLTWCPLQYLGRISYSRTSSTTRRIGVVSIGCSLTPSNPAAAALWMAGGVVVSVGEADVFYLCVESPSLRLVKRLKA